MAIQPGTSCRRQLTIHRYWALVLMAGIGCGGGVDQAKNQSFAGAAGALHDGAGGAGPIGGTGVGGSSATGGAVDALGGLNGMGGWVGGAASGVGGAPNGTVADGQFDCQGRPLQGDSCSAPLLAENSIWHLAVAGSSITITAVGFDSSQLRCDGTWTESDFTCDAAWSRAGRQCSGQLHLQVDTSTTLVFWLDSRSDVFANCQPSR